MVAIGGHLGTGHSRRHPTPGLVGSRPSLARGSQEETEIWEIRSCMQTRVVGKRYTPEGKMSQANPDPIKVSTVKILIIDWHDGHNY